MSFSLLSASGITNSYNNSETVPKVRIANWVEERALQESTGFSRGNFIQHTKTMRDPNFTAQRTILSGNPAPVKETFKSLTHEEMQKPFKSQESAVAPLGRRSVLKEKERLQQAMDLQRTRELERRAQEEKEIEEARWNGRLKLNKSKVIVNENVLRQLDELASSSSQDPLMQRAITVHDSLIHTQRSAAAIGEKSMDKRFHKTTDFSKPSNEYTKSMQR